MPLGNPAVLPIQPFIGYGIDFEQEARVFAADTVMPWFKTEKTNGWFPVPDARNFLRAEDATWGRETGATRVVSQYGKATFLAQPFGLEELVGDLDAKDWPGGPGDMATQTQRQLLQRILVAREVRIEAAIDASSSYGTTAVTGTAQWASTATNPRLDVQKASSAIRKRIGRGANRMVLPGGVVEVVTGTQLAGSAGAAILDAIKYTRPAMGDTLTEELMAQYFRLSTVKFAEAVQQLTTAHTLRTVGVGLPEAGVYIWDQKEAYVFYNGAPGAKEPNFGTSFGPELATPDDYRDERAKGTAYRIIQVLDEKEVCTSSMNVLTTVIA
jgi:hypothetical protein